MKNFVLKGDICYSLASKELKTAKAAHLVSLDGKSAGVYETLPERYQDLPLVDCSGHLILPGATDLHVHAPQFSFQALGMDLELLDWLNTYTFPAESKFSDLEYAHTIYSAFVEDLKRGPNTRAVIFATRHVPATLLLMDLLEESGIRTMVGKVNMDRNAIDGLCEKDAALALESTRAWLRAAMGHYQYTTPILTPRFIPACSDALMAGLGEIQRELNLPVQSHLSENQKEVDWVESLRPEAKSYGHAYLENGLFGGNVPTVMAHCVWPTEEEFSLMKQQKIFVAHCPQSNTNLASGIAPVRRFLEAGIPVGLGSDMAAGVHSSIFRAMTDAIGVSKLYWRLIDQDAAPLTLEEAFYLGTLGGGSFFGRVGSFAEGYDLDALVIDDRGLSPFPGLSIADRLARVVYLSDDRHIRRKYVRGRPISLP